MYSPKIDEELIPRLYRLGKLKKVPMTRLVNDILKRGLLEMEENGKEQVNPQQILRQTGTVNES